MPLTKLQFTNGRALGGGIIGAIRQQALEMHSAWHSLTTVVVRQRLLARLHQHIVSGLL